MLYHYSLFYSILFYSTYSITGKYCLDGEVQGDCNAGFLCISGSWTPVPRQPDVNETVGTLCPFGRYCPEGTIVPESCAPGTVSYSSRVVCSCNK